MGTVPAQVPYFPGWLEVFTLQLKHTSERDSDRSQSTWPITLASFHTATAIAEGALGLPPQEAAAHHRRALQLLRNWQIGRQVPDLGYNYSSEGSETGAGSGDAAVQPPALFWDGLRLLPRVYNTLSKGPRLALELEALIPQLQQASPPGSADFEDSTALVEDGLANCSAKETCAAMGVESSDGLPVSASFAALRGKNDTGSTLAASAARAPCAARELQHPRPSACLAISATVIGTSRIRCACKHSPACTLLDVARMLGCNVKPQKPFKQLKLVTGLPSI